MQQENIFQPMSELISAYQLKGRNIFKDVYTV